jgi:hypothetical protein
MQTHGCVDTVSGCTAGLNALKVGDWAKHSAGAEYFTNQMGLGVVLSAGGIAVRQAPRGTSREKVTNPGGGPAASCLESKNTGQHHALRRPARMWDATYRRCI